MSKFWLVLTTKAGHEQVMTRQLSELSSCPHSIIRYMGRHFVFSRLDHINNRIVFDEATITELVP